MKNGLIVAATIAASCLASCADPAPIDEPAKPFKLNGMILAGTPADAKQSGFTECGEPTDMGVTCSTAGSVTIMGAQTRGAHVWLNWEIGDEKKALSDLKYKHVTARFWPVDVDYGCDAEGDKYACATNQNHPLVVLERKLIKAGWLATDRRWGTEYYNADQPYLISVNDGRVGRGDKVTEVTFTPESKEAIVEVVNEEKAEQANRAQRAAENANFVDEMKAR